jgi:hypothetical protein
MWSRVAVPGAKPRILSVIYHSAATPGLSSFDVDEILAASRTRNKQNDITGMLLLENGRFLQALEGPEEDVRDLMARIEQDRRHEHVRVLVEETQDGRRFPDWAMARGHVAELEALALDEYFAALLEARDELPSAPTRTERIRAWFHG